MAAPQTIFRVRRKYNQWVANQTLEDYALRFTAKGARRWSSARVANTALGAISFLALEAIGGAVTISYGFDNTVAAVCAVSLIIFLTSVPIAYYAARYGVDIDLLTRGAGFGYIGSTITSLIYASFTFIFFALEAAIMARALESLLGIPLEIGYLVSALLVIPLVTHGITFISRFQLWTQPLWICMQLLPFAYIAFHDLAVVQDWTQFQGQRQALPGHGGAIDILLFGAASAVLFSLIAQIGEQVDFLRFLPERTPATRRRWWLALLAGGPGWIVVGALKILAGSLLAFMAFQQGASPASAADPTLMYSVAFGYLTASPERALALAGIFVIVSQLKINVTNAYAGSIAWSNFFSRLTHRHPGRVVWLVFNVCIALMLMELGVYQALEQILGVYAIVAVAWVGALVADLVVNKPLGLSPAYIEFKRAHLYDINPVGVGAMVIASCTGIAAHLGAFGDTAQALSPYLVLLTAFTTAPLIAWATGGRFYLARTPELIASSASPVQCVVCEHAFEAEDTARCPAYGGHICSLCCSLDARCQDHCKPHGRISQQLLSLLRCVLPHELVERLNVQLGHFIALMLVISLGIGAFLALLFSLASFDDPSVGAVFANLLWQAFFILLIVAGVFTWLFVLAHESRRAAQEESLRQTLLLQDEVEAHQRTDRELQKAKEIAEAANNAKSRYLAGISHELRTPLNTVLGYAQLLEQDHSIPAERREAVTVIRRSGEHLADLIEGLLDISKIEAGRLDIYRDEVNLPAQMAQLVNMFRLQAQAKGIAFDYVCETPLPEYVATDEKRLRQILINLIGNAIKFTARGSVSLTLRYRNQVAHFTIRDTGIGIAPEDMERIFKPFERVRKPGAPAVPGTGLGLTITRLLTEIMGGEITVESRPGEGTVFTVELLLSSIAAPRDNAAPERRIRGYTGARKTVMVVDDEPSQRGLLGDILTPLGFEVLEAQDGPACLAMLEHATPDIFLLDISMPGMNGWELAQALRERGVRQPVVMVSADARELQRDSQAPHWHDDYVVKPVRVNAILDKLAALLGLDWFHETQPPLSPQPANALPALPDARHLVELKTLAELGYLNGLRDKAHALAESGEASPEFIEYLQGLIAQYRFDQIGTLWQGGSCDPRH